MTQGFTYKEKGRAMAEHRVIQTQDKEFRWLLEASRNQEEAYTSSFPESSWETWAKW